MNAIAYPVTLNFKVLTLANDFVARDAGGNPIFYVKQKMFKLIDEVNVYADEAQTSVLYTFKADKWLDFSAAYTIRNQSGAELGKVTRKGWKSLWKLRYELIDSQGQHDMMISEENPWINALDTLISEVPGLGLLTGYFLNPTYLVSTTEGAPVARLRKLPSFWGRLFRVEKIAETSTETEERVLMSLLMMILNDRSRG